MINPSVKILRSIWRDRSNEGQRLQRILSFVGWQLWKRTIARPIVLKLFNGTRFIVYPDSAVSSGLIYHRIPDYESISFLRHHLEGGSFVDVGCNVGSVSLLIADRVENALMFEPNPEAAVRARENVAINRLNFHVHQVALSDRVGEAFLEDRGGVNSCNRTIKDQSESEFITRIIPMITFDHFVEQRGPINPPVKAIKIDVEGHENAVLKGMRGCLEHMRPNIIMFEYLQRTDIVKTLALFDEVDYSIFRLSSDGPVMVDNSVEPLQNLFSCPDELLSVFGVAGIY